MEISPLPVRRTIVNRRRLFLPREVVMMSARNPLFRNCLLGVSFCALILIALTPSAWAQSVRRPAALERGPIDLPRVMQRASLIVHGIVSGTEVKWVDRVIYTFYDLVVSETIRGRARSGIVIAVPGGSLGNVRLAVPGAPSVGVGDEAVLFGRAFRDQSSFTPVGTFDGFIAVTAERSGGRRTVTPRGILEDLDSFLDEVRTLNRQ